MLETLTLTRALEAVLALLAFTIALHCLKLFKSFTGETVSQILNASETMCLAYAAAIMAGAIGYRTTRFQQQFSFYYAISMNILIAATILYSAYTFYTTWQQLETPPQEPTIIKHQLE